MVHPGLAFAVQVHSRIEMRTPEKGMSRAQRLLVEAPDRQMYVAEVIANMDPAHEDRGAQHQNEQPERQQERHGQEAIRGFEPARPPHVTRTVEGARPETSSTGEGARPAGQQTPPSPTSHVD